MNEFGFFNEELGTYTITNPSIIGSYEYILRNNGLLLKVDQHGFIMAQIDAPTGEALFKREKRETTSPVKTYFELDGRVYNNFDLFKADDICIVYSPKKVEYALTFGGVKVVTEIFVCENERRFLYNVRFVNTGDTCQKIKILTCAYPYLNELLMAPWDKPEWYTRTEFLKDESAFLTTRFSVAGNVKERKYLSLVSSGVFGGFELSSERLINATKNFNTIPSDYKTDSEETLYAFEQCMAIFAEATIDRGGEYSYTDCYAVATQVEDVQEMMAQSKRYFDKEIQDKELAAIDKKFRRLFDIKTVKTGNADFDSFVNGFLPLELSWVSELDRGWPTGMRGVRDASNDFQGYLSYDKEKCRQIITNIFSKQRSDGWYPRQVPFGSGTKFDLREFVDSACFFTEYVYDYLAYTGDYSILSENYPYYDSNVAESGFDHLLKGIDFLVDDKNTGEHGLVKMRGGDWLDCLSSAGSQGRGETVMVSCQVIMCIDYIKEICSLTNHIMPEKFSQGKQRLVESINKHAYNGKYYNAVFADSGNWLFSNCDEDGQERVYVPTNAYAIISGVADGKEQGILDEVFQLRTTEGYKLFSTPLGTKNIKGIGKMGTGDFQPFFAENASVYNHGSQCFLLRALAKIGDYDAFYDVLKYALPLYSDSHDPKKTCSAPYAITNCYHLVPSFYGRSGFSFLTGSVAMIERAIYSWMFGINFTLEKMVITPCLPEQYKDAQVVTPFGDNKITMNYIGYGNRIVSAQFNGKPIGVEQDGRSIAIDKLAMNSDAVINIQLSK